MNEHLIFQSQEIIKLKT